MPLTAASLSPSPGVGQGCSGQHPIAGNDGYRRSFFERVPSGRVPSNSNRDFGKPLDGTQRVKGFLNRQPLTTDSLKCNLEI